MCYSNKTESVSLRKCTHDHLITNKVHLSTITVTNSSQSFYLQDGGKNKLADMEQNYITDTLCIILQSQQLSTLTPQCKL